MSKSVHKVVIIGAGPAGLTAAIYASRANLSPIIIEGPKPGGQLMGTTMVENWPGNASIMGPELMINMQNHAKKLNATTIAGSVTSVDFQTQPFSITIDHKETVQAHSVIIATGALPNRLNCPGEEEFWGKGVSTCTTCDGAFFKDQEVLVVGGGDSAMESASFLQRNGNRVTIVHRRDSLSASHAMQKRVLNNDAFQIIYEHTVTQIHGENGKVVGVTLTNLKNQQTQYVKTSGIFLAIGLKPNTAIFNNQLALTPLGHIQVTDLVKTSILGIFTCGDVSDPKYRQAIVSAGFGCIAALQAEHFLAERNL